MSETDQQHMIEFVTGSKEGRQTPWPALSNLLFNGRYTNYTIDHTLRRHGFARYVGRKKPIMDHFCRQLRLEFAYQHRYWGLEQWAQVLFTDECYLASGEGRKRQRVTRRIGEAYNDTCIVPRVKRGNG